MRHGCYFINTKSENTTKPIETTDYYLNYACLLIF